MSAYLKRKKIMERIGAVEVKRVGIEGNSSTWHITMCSGFVHIIEANRMSSETGVLQTLEARLRRA